MSAALAAIAKVISLIATEKTLSSWKTALETLSDASKLMTDLQHKESVIRRSLLMSNIAGKMRDVLALTPISKNLFGDSLEETVKSAKAMQTSYLELKKTNTQSKASTNAKNTKAPPRLNKSRQSAYGGDKKTETRNTSNKPFYLKRDSRKGRQQKNRRSPPRRR